MTGTREFSDSSPSSVTEAKALVERIQDHTEAKRDKTPGEEAAKLRRLQNRILESLDDAAHVVPELFQNADDVGDGCTEVTIRLHDDELVVENDGEGMTEAEVKALGEFAESTKRDLSQIGHFGIGFKTVFSVTGRPHVDSGYVSLEYSVDDPEIPQSAFEEAESKFEGTRVRLPLSEDLSDTRLDEISSQLDEIDRLLPFLNNLRTITVKRDSETTTYERVNESDKDDGRVTVHKYGNKDDDTPCETWHYRLFTEPLNADSETIEALAEERDLDLESLEDRDVDTEVELAFPISKQGYPVGHDDSRLFCYFPASRETNLPFDVQADFLLKSSREQIRPGHPVNDKFLQVAGSLVKDAIQTFQAEDVPPSRLLTLIPDADADRPDYLTPLTDEAFDALSGLQFVPVESGGTCAPEDLLVLPSRLHDVIPLAEFCAEYEAADVVHPSQELTAEDYDRLAALDSTRVVSVPETLEELADMDFLSTLGASEVVDLLAAVEGYLDSIYPYDDEYDSTIEALKSLPVYPIRGDDRDRQPLDTIDDDIYRPDRQSGSAYEPFYDDLTLLGDSLLSTLRSKNISDQMRVDVRKLFSERLDIEEIQHKNIVEKVVAEAFATPENHDDETLEEYVEYLRNHAQSYADASNTKLRTEAGDYKPPNELYLPKQYLKGRYNSSIVLDTLTDRDPVSTSYLDRNPEAEDTESWRKFFATLGALTHLPVSPNVDHPTREPFQSQDKIEAYLDEHDDEGTTVRPDRDTTPYDGRKRQYRWMKRADAQHGLVDYALSEVVEDRFEDAARTTDGFGREFVKMLDAYWETTDTNWENHDWDGTYQNSMFRDYCWSVPSNGYDVNTEESGCPTSFLALLRKTPWLPGQDEERYQPRHLYEPNSVTKHAGVPLLAEAVADLSSTLFDTLNIPDDVGLEQHANAIEQVVAERPERDASEIDREVRSHLYSLVDRVDDASEDEIAELTEQLTECPFVYVKHAEPEFRTIDQVVWSKGLGNHIVAINDDYRVFEGFFTDALDIDTEPILDDYIEYLGQADADDWSTVEDAWTEVIKRVAYSDSQDHNLTDVARDLAEKGAIPSTAETLVPYDEIQYIARDVGTAERLPEALAKQVAFPWYDKRMSDHLEAVNRLTTLLDATRLEEELNHDVITPPHQPTETTLGERYPLLLNVGYSLLADRDEHDAQDLLEEVAGYTVQTADTVRCKYRLGSDSTKVDESSYIDQDKKHVYVAESDAAQLKLVEDIAAALELTDSTRNKFVELVQGTIGKEESLVNAYLDSHDLPYEQIDSSTQNVDGESNDAEVPDEEEESEGDSVPNPHEDRVSEGTATRPDDTVDEDIETPPPDTGSTVTSPPEGTDEVKPRNVSDQSSKSMIDIADTPENDRDGGTKPGSGVSSFGETDEAQKTGNAGEQLVLDHLRDLLKAELDDPKVTSCPDTRSNAYRVKGYSDGHEVTVTLKKVPDQETPRSDLLVDGASLIRQEHEFAVDEVASDERTFVEVKSSKNEAKTFRITKLEHNQAQNNSEYLIARPVEVDSKNERIETVFDTVPRIQVHTESNGRLKADDLDLEYHGMWVSY
ncbi:sacsin N-terminal ATP-binding-like domain-containing protein [Halarchaeum sp. P4]|uniref:sacsin N-terminal ATP-binding-like domain-containing protein n=1 Tax=Halarchaeum sp. P4 TaxID=3421639 RepID=UPI003EBF601F